MKEQNKVLLRGSTATLNGEVQEGLSEKVMLTVRPEAEVSYRVCLVMRVQMEQQKEKS